MLETVITSAIVAVFLSVVVHFLSFWGFSIRLRRVEMQLAEWEERLMTEVKRRAAKASVEARASKLNPLDEALIRQHTGVEMSSPGMSSPDEPWWDKLVNKQ